MPHSQPFMRPRKRKEPPTRVLTMRSASPWLLRCFAAAAAIAVMAQDQLSAAAEISLDVPVRAVVRPANQAELSSDIAAPVVELRFDEGERFAKGDTLVRFDCRVPQARLDAARATHREIGVKLKGAKYLHRMDAGSVEDVEIAQAQLARANAEIAELSALLERCDIVAPFDGGVMATAIRVHEFAKPGEPLISVVDLGNPEIEMIAPSQWLANIEPGMAFRFTIDETGTTHAGIVERTAAIIDPVSQTVKIYGKFRDQAARILPGMSGVAEFDNLGH